MPELHYEPDGKVLSNFMRSNAFVRGIRGPIGSGKTVACCIELFRRACQQKPGPGGIRRSRAVIIRNTGPELETTTIATWLAWFPEAHYGRFNWAPPLTHNIKAGDVECEAIFLALDREEDVKKLYSLECTFAWINEARFIPKLVVDTLTERIGRFPKILDGGATWDGLIMDTNAMEPDHWWPIVAGDVPLPDDIGEEEAAMLQKPDNWEFFNQPGAMLEEKDSEDRTTGWKQNPLAENVRWLKPGYYQNTIRGKTRAHILRNVGNQLTIVREGKAVYPSFSEEAHLAKEALPILPSAAVEIGMDFGLTPAAVLSQTLHGRRLIQRELVALNMGITAFAQELRRLVARTYPGCAVVIHGDPAGDQRAQTDETTPFQVLRAAGFDARPAPSNDFALRVEAVEAMLTRLIEGRPGFLLDPQCRHLRKAMAGGYHYARVQGHGEVRYADRPIKNQSSHVGEALQYLAMGVGEGTLVLSGGKKREMRSIKTGPRPSPFQRLTGMIRR